MEQPKWAWDAFGTHKDTLDPCCPIASAAGGHWHHGGAAWPGWAVAVTQHHPEQQGLGLPAGRAEEVMEQRHTVEGVLDARGFSIQCLWRSCETMWGGVRHLSGTSPGLLSSGHRHHLQPEQRALPHGHSTWPQLSFPLKMNSCHPRNLCIRCLNFVSLLGD